jgi:hypothetical protein
VENGRYEVIPVNTMSNTPTSPSAVGGSQTSSTDAEGDSGIADPEETGAEDMWYIIADNVLYATKRQAGFVTICKCRLLDAWHSKALITIIELSARIKRLISALGL